MTEDSASLASGVYFERSLKVLSRSKCVKYSHFGDAFKRKTKRPSPVLRLSDIVHYYSSNLNRPSFVKEKFVNFKEVRLLMEELVDCR